MPDELQLHVATRDELTEAHKNCFEFWQRGRTPDEHAQNRLDNPSHQRATWYVGCLDDRVVTSFGSYPFQFQIRGQVATGMGVGSVYTVDSHRKKGYAARLMQWAEQQERRRGMNISVLYSDIDPNYYAGMGYLVCPCFQGTCTPAEVSPDRLAGAFRLVPFSAPDGIQPMAELYRLDSTRWAASIVRSEQAWEVGLKLYPQDIFYWLEAGDGQRRGYVRLRPTRRTMRIVDYGLAERTDDALAGLYAAAIAEARERGAEKFSCWLADTPVARRFFDVAPRTREITMLKPLTDTVSLDDAVVAATDQFHELDHI